jgi:uncharacterized BrkB/YihY/UPF0761 family membrane protein
MTWMWMSAIVVLVGAELNSEIERHAIDTPEPLAGETLDGRSLP